MNLGQLALLLRAEFLVDAVSYRVRGRPLTAAELEDAITATGGLRMKDGNGLLQLTAKDFKSDQEVRWCPGCGDYAILAGVQSFLPEARRSEGEPRVRLRHRLRGALPVLRGDLRDALDPRPRAGDRDGSSRPCAPTSRSGS